MPGEQGFITALNAPTVNLALVVAVLAILALIVVVMVSGTVNRRAMESSGKQTDANTEMLKVLGVQGNQIAQQGILLERALNLLENGQQIQQEQMKTTQQFGVALTRHEEKSAVYVQEIQDTAAENHKSLLERIEAKARDTITNIIEETQRVVDASTERILNLMQPALEPLGEMRITLKEMRKDEQQRADARKAQLDGIEAKLATAEQNVVTVMNQLMDQMKGGDSGQIADDLGGGDSAGGSVSAGDASGSTGDNGTGHSGDTIGTTDGSGD